MTVIVRVASSPRPNVTVGENSGSVTIRSSKINVTIKKTESLPDAISVVKIQSQTPPIVAIRSSPVSASIQSQTIHVSLSNTGMQGGGVQSVTGLDTDNADPKNPVVAVAVDGTTITGAGTPGSPLVASQSAPAWGDIIGTLSDQTDLQEALDAKLSSVVAGVNISVDNTDPTRPIINSLSDRYKTTSSTSQTIVSSGSLTFTVAANLAYTPQQEVVIAYDASNHMHGTVTAYSGTTLVVDIKHKTGSGTYAAWTINLDGTPVDALTGFGTAGQLAQFTAARTLESVAPEDLNLKAASLTNISDLTLSYSGGNLTGVTYATGLTKTLSYNGDGTLNQVVSTYPDASVITKTMVYSDGNLTGVTVT